MLGSTAYCMRYVLKYECFEITIVYVLSSDGVLQESMRKLHACMHALNFVHTYQYIYSYKSDMVEHNHLALSIVNFDNYSWLAGFKRLEVMKLGHSMNM